MSPNLAAVLDELVTSFEGDEQRAALEIVADAPAYADALLNVHATLDEMSDELVKLETEVVAAVVAEVEPFLGDDPEALAEVRDAIDVSVREALRTSALEALISRLTNDAYVTGEDCRCLRLAVEYLTA